MEEEEEEEEEEAEEAKEEEEGEIWRLFTDLTYLKCLMQILTL